MSVLGFEINPFPPSSDFGETSALFVTMIRVSEQQDFGTLSFGGLGKPKTSRQGLEMGGFWRKSWKPSG
jgi:hypothetical protein